MSSNDNERAQSGDMIEITTHLRNDLGKRMQVSTSDGLSVVALDNRMRVTVAHGDYKVVRRCGRPGTVDIPAKKRGRPSNAEIAARAAAERTPPAVEVKAPVVTAKAIVTDADVAGLEAALYDVQVTRKVQASLTDPRPNIPHDQVMARSRALLDAKKQPTLTVDESKVTVQSDDVSVEAAVELMTQEQIDAATENLRPLYGLTQEEFDAMTTHVEPRGFIAPERKHSHYFKTIPCNQIDVYRVLAAFNVADPCIQHAVKKLLVAGGRGSKDISRDVGEAIDTLQRWQEMRREEAA